MLQSRRYAEQARYDVDPNRDLVGLGVANLAGSFASGYPVGASASRSGAALAGGGRSSLVPIVGALVIALVLLIFAPVIENMPVPVLAGGYFAMPSHPPERGLKAGHDYDLAILRELDRLGFTEAWIGEHHTAPWEPHPSPDLLVAQALLQTEQLRIGPGGFLLPYHHPAELANRVAMLDHISDGRLNFGIAASGLPSDWAMFNVDGLSGVNRDMTREALDIILRLWAAEEPFHYDGQYWQVDRPDEMFGVLRPTSSRCRTRIRRSASPGCRRARTR